MLRCPKPLLCFLEKLGREKLLYLVFGGMTTALSLIVYVVLTRLFLMGELYATGLSWFVSVLFAYVTNKVFVFHCKQQTVWLVVKEMGLFFLVRGASGLLDLLIMFLFVTKFGMSDLLIKFLSSTVVILLNYIFSKCLIFKKSTPAQNDTTNDKKQ